MKILLVEDDIDFRNLLVRFLQMEQYEIEVAGDGNEGWRKFTESSYNLIILDVMMPEKDGFALAEEIRTKDQEVPIIFLTARNLKEDKVRGLQIADDYICKPFDVDELLLRMKNVFRRTGTSVTEDYRLGNMLFSFKKLKLWNDEQEHQLTLKEAELLQYFIDNHNQTLKREVILNDIWGDDDYFLGRSMDVFISRLRKYLKTEPSVAIETVRGVGFIFRM